MATDANTRDSINSAENAGVKALTDLLQKIADLREVKDRLEAELKTANSRLSELEEAAAESIDGSGVDGLKAAGRTWWVQDNPHVSVPAANKAEVLRIAREIGRGDEFVDVARATLKSWLVERARERPQDGFGQNTPFDGLISVYVERSLRSRVAR